jgi:hypothetical protein
LKFRVNLKGVAGDWQPLANLVRLPMLTELTCPASTELACQLTGTHLFLIDSVSGDAQFSHPVTVPDGFLGVALPVPHPSAGSLYIKLRDNPEVVNPIRLAVQSLPAPFDDSGRAAARRSAAAVPPAETVTTPAAVPGAQANVFPTAAAVTAPSVAVAAPVAAPVAVPPSVAVAPAQSQSQAAAPTVPAAAADPASRAAATP